MEQPPLPPFLAHASAPTASDAPAPPSPSPAHGQQVAPRPRVFRNLLALATIASILSTIAFVTYLFSPRGTEAQRAQVHPLYLAGLIGLALAEGCQLLAILALIARWASHDNTERRLREIVMLLLSLIPYMVIVILLVTVIVYLRARRQDPASERTREARQKLKDQAADTLVAEGSHQSGAAASAQARAPLPPNAATSARPTLRDTVRRVVGPSTQRSFSEAGDWLVTVAMIAVVLATIATLGAVTPLNTLVAPPVGAVALTTGAPTATVTPTIAPTATPASGSLVREMAAGSDPEGLVKAADGSVWFADAGGGAIGHMTPGGQVTEFPLPNSNNRPENLVIGPDGNIWFTEFSGNKVGRLTPSGSITEYQASPQYNVFGLYDIAVGPDGNLWCTTSTDDYIDRVTPSGVVTQFHVPWPQLKPSGTPNQQPGIVAGPDGRMWFAIPELGDIGVVDMSGAITEIPLGTQNTQDIGDLTVGPDGALWFSEPGANFIGRVTTAGSVTEFPLPPKTYGPYSGAITFGPDGNLWFTYGHGVGRMTPSGGVTVFDPLPTSEGGPVDIITGPDGNIWITQGNWSKIVEIAL